MQLHAVRNWPVTVELKLKEVHVGHVFSIKRPSYIGLWYVKKCLGSHSGSIHFPFVISAATIPATASPLKHR
jgi:hypothetical protein